MTIITHILRRLLNIPFGSLQTEISRAISIISSSTTWPFGPLPPTPPLPDLSVIARDMRDQLADALECALCCDVL
jgi:hypothetical protein